ncbi:hypothetical protein TL16_g06658 [Triparma laevis f. inornata]|uniref:PH domain-containing protein n=1 Tax=Triparma laevis f. inornata TaxID=1714386 RepID=A0A9W7EDR7_9STRA|nr:hypothetical protein TL16_g06658 [Triparma laevis f. inornata]
MSTPTESLPTSNHTEILSAYSSSSSTLHFTPLTGPGLTLESSALAGDPTVITLNEITPELKVDQVLNAKLFSLDAEDQEGRDCVVTKLTPSTASIAFGATLAGKYALRVTSWDGFVKAGDVDVFVRGGVASYRCSRGVGGGISLCGPGGEARFIVNTYDYWGNRCTTGGANISITTQGRGITSGSALDNGDGTYLVTYEVKDKLGKYVNRDGKASTHSKLPVKRYKKGWLYYSMDTALPAHALAAKNPPNFQRMWFEISAGTLACYGATDPNTSTSPDFPKHSPTFTLNLEECLIKLSKSNASFLTAPATDPACQWQILHPTHGTVNFCVDSKDFAYAWIVVCQDSCGKQEVKKVHSKSGKIHGEQQVNDDEIAINIAIDGNVLDCCPFTPKISSKSVLEKKLNRRASVEDLVQRNILQSKTSAIEFFETAGHSPEKQAEDAKKRMERKRQSIAGSFLNDEGKKKNMEQRKVELKRVGGKQINVGAVSQGFLLKKGNYRHNWKKRFFVLSINLESADELVRLVYFAKQPKDIENWKKQEKHAKGTIILNGAYIQTSRKTAHKNKAIQYDFSITDADKRTYDINAFTEQDRGDWMESIQTCINEAAARDGRPPAEPPTLQQSNTNSTETTASRTSSNLDCLVDIPKEGTAIDDLRTLGRAQREVLDDLIQKLKQEVGDSSNLENFQDKQAFTKLTALWKLRASHKVINALLNSLSECQDLPLQFEIVNCLARTLEIEKPLAAAQTKRKTRMMKSPPPAEEEEEVRPKSSPFPPPRQKGTRSGKRMDRSKSGNHLTFKFEDTHRGRSKTKKKSKSKSPEKKRPKFFLQRNTTVDEENDDWENEDMEKKLSEYGYPVDAVRDVRDLKISPGFLKATGSPRNASPEQNCGRSKTPKFSPRTEIYKATFKIWKALDLHSKVDDSAYSDPYLTLVPITKAGERLTGSKVKTSVMKNNCNPEWEEEFAVEFDNFAIHHFEGTVHDKNENPNGHSSSLGYFSVFCADIFSSSLSEKHTYFLEGPGIERGKVIISYCARSEETGESRERDGVVTINKKLGILAKVKAMQKAEAKDKARQLVKKYDREIRAGPRQGASRMDIRDRLGVRKRTSMLPANISETFSKNDAFFERETFAYTSPRPKRLRPKSNPAAGRRVWGGGSGGGGGGGGGEGGYGGGSRSTSADPAGQMFRNSKRISFKSSMRGARFHQEQRRENRQRNYNMLNWTPEANNPYLKKRQAATLSPTRNVSLPTTSPAFKRLFNQNVAYVSSSGYGSKTYSPPSPGKARRFTLARSTSTPPSSKKKIKDVTGLVGRIKAEQEVTKALSQENRTAVTGLVAMLKLQEIKLSEIKPTQMRRPTSLLDVARYGNRPASTGMVKNMNMKSPKGVGQRGHGGVWSPRSAPHGMNNTDGFTRSQTSPLKINFASPAPSKTWAPGSQSPSFKAKGKKRATIFDVINKGEGLRGSKRSPSPGKANSDVEKAQWERVKEFLKNLKMLHHKNLFYKNGINSLAAIELLSKIDLDKMKIESVDQTVILRAIATLTAKTNQSIMTAVDQGADAKTSILEAFDAGEPKKFGELWSSMLPVKVRDQQSAAYGVSKQLELEARAYFCVKALNHDEEFNNKEETSWKWARGGFEAYLKGIRDVTDNLELYDGLVGMSAKEAKENETFSGMLEAKYGSSLRKKILGFLDSVFKEPEADGSPVSSPKPYVVPRPEKGAGGYGTTYVPPKNEVMWKKLHRTSESDLEKKPAFGKYTSVVKGAMEVGEEEEDEVVVVPKKMKAPLPKVPVDLSKKAEVEVEEEVVMPKEEVKMAFGHRMNSGGHGDAWMGEKGKMELGEKKTPLDHGRGISIDDSKKKEEEEAVVEEEERLEEAKEVELEAPMSNPNPPKSPRKSRWTGMFKKVKKEKKGVEGGGLPDDIKALMQAEMDKEAAKK